MWFTHRHRFARNDLQSSEINGSPSKNLNIKTPLVAIFFICYSFFATSGVLMSGFFEGLPLHKDQILRFMNFGLQKTLP